MRSSASARNLKQPRSPGRGGGRLALAFLLLLAVTLISYYPAWHGQPLWDDEAHITAPELRSFNGLIRIWVDLEATQQYYPLVHSVFWLQQKLWGHSTLGYHLVNIILHACNAMLFWLILSRLLASGTVQSPASGRAAGTFKALSLAPQYSLAALMAALIFALHPVHVESVAWISELKNTLSALFYLGSMLVYLRFDETRQRRFFVAAFCLFVAGLMCKTVIASLPAALLVIFWGKRGSLRWKADVYPLLPFFVCGVVAGLFTAWVEKKIIGAQGAEFSFSLLERFLIAGRAFWFYLSKLLWPANLMFNYPRWEITPTAGWQYLFPASALLLFAVLWLLRGWSRAPLAALLLFAGTLFPALGFLNVYPFRYSFVADHFQYLASLAVIGLLACALAAAVNRLGRGGWPTAAGVSIFALGSLAVLTWRHSGAFSNMETLWRDTLKKNPESWLAHDKLALELARQKRFEEALPHFVEFAQRRPQDPSGPYNHGACLYSLGRTNEAVALMERALELKPTYFDAHCALASIFTSIRWDRAVRHYVQAMRVQPDAFRSPELLNNIAWTLATHPDPQTRNGTEAVRLAEWACQLRGDPEHGFLDTLAAAYAEAGRFADATNAIERAVQRAEVFAGPDTVVKYRTRLDLYRSAQAYRQPGADLKTP